MENNMKGLNKIALVVAIAAASSAQAELVSMDDSAMSAATGQAGLTIDINAAKINIGAIDYKDAGFLSIKDVAITGSDFTSAIDNIRLTVDVAGGTLAPGGGADLGVAALGATYLAGTTASPLVDAVVVGGFGVDQNALIDDGDLVIGIRSQSGLVDYGVHIGSVGLGASTEAAGSVTDGTVLVSDLNLAGMLGPIDIVIDGNNGGMNINAYFNTAGTLTLPFVNTSMGLSIHNSRGTDRTVLTLAAAAGGTDVSFAHAQLNITSNATGLALDLQDFSGDIDLTNITMGSSPSIGDVYITDLQMSASTVIYGH